jgi:hypothetical protein
MAASPQPRIHSITDISHEFTFYFDGRFAANYCSGGADARNWGTLYKCDLANANLLVLQSGASPCRYLPEDIAAVRRFLEAGGGVLVLGDHALFRDEKEYRLNDLARALGAEFVETPAQEPLKPAGELNAEGVKYYGGRTIVLADLADWRVLVADASGRTVLARRSVGKGSLLVSSRGLVGRQPDAKDPINDQWWKPLLLDLAKGKPISADRPPGGQPAEIRLQRGGLTISTSEYLRPYADATVDCYSRVRPTLERTLGVPPSPGMLTNLILLATGGGGFSSGQAIGIGIWWGDFPSKQYGMVELLSHEATHSWVLPFPEPLWNEGIATYAGILTGRELGLSQEADATLKGWIDGARQHDPDMTRMDLTGSSGPVPHVVAMAKPMWIFEELRKEKPDILARYFQTKRRLIDPQKVKQYTADDSVAVLSIAMGRDLFPWFQSLGTRVDRARTTIPAP